MHQNCVEIEGDCWCEASVKLLISGGLRIQLSGEFFLKTKNSRPGADVRW